MTKKRKTKRKAVSLGQTINHGNPTKDFVSERMIKTERKGSRAVASAFTTNRRDHIGPGTELILNKGRKLRRSRPREDKDSTFNGGLTTGAASMNKTPAGLTLGEMRSTYAEPDHSLPGGKPSTTLPAGLAYGEIEMHDGAERTITGTSIFDPVLCELAYRWFCPPAGTILDPFAGGSVRGIVASRLGRSYVGIDLSERQINANRSQAKTLCKKPHPMPTWIVGDSQSVLAPEGTPDGHGGTKHLKNVDFLFSCPPYADLEVYSDDPFDLSTMEWPEFVAGYRKIIALSCSHLRDDRFACFVVGDVRDKDGFYRNLPGVTIQAFTDAGLKLYNQAILVTAAGSLPVRVGRQFQTARKLGNTHQYVQVFVKGDPRKATAAVGDVEFGEPEEFGATQPVDMMAALKTAVGKSPAPGIASDAKYGERLTGIGGEIG